MTNNYTTLLIHHLFTNLLDNDELEHALEFIFEDDDRIFELIVRVDLEIYQLLVDQK